MPEPSSNERFIIVSCAILIVFAWLLQLVLYAFVIAQGADGLDITNRFRMTCWILTLLAALFIPAILVIAAGHGLEKYISERCFFAKYLQPSLIALLFCVFGPNEIRAIAFSVFLSGYAIVFASRYVTKRPPSRGEPKCGANVPPPELKRKMAPARTSKERIIIASCVVSAVFAWLLQPMLFWLLFMQSANILDITNIYEITCWTLTLLACLFIPATLLVAAGKGLEKYIGNYCFIIKYLQPSLMGFLVCILGPNQYRLPMLPASLSGFLTISAYPHVIKWFRSRGEAK